MRTIFTIFFIILLSNSFTFSQLTLYYPSGVDVSGDTIIVTGRVDTTAEIVSHIYVKNAGIPAQNVWCKKSYVNIVAGTNNTFCWGGLCELPTTFSSSHSTSINPGQTDSTNFAGHYYPNEKSGCTEIIYKFWFTHGDTVQVLVKYDIFTGIDELKNNGAYMAGPYPNPADNSAIINYNIGSASKGTFEIYNLVGNLVKKTEIRTKTGSFSISTGDIPSGTYFYRFISDTKVLKADKLFIIH